MRPKLIMQLEVTYVDGSTEAIVTHGEFGDEKLAGDIGADCCQTAFMTGEVYDARLERPGWDMPEMAESGPMDLAHKWVDSMGVDSPGGRLVSETMEPIKIVDTLRPQWISEPKPGVFVFDTGQNLAGWAELRVKGQRGDMVTMRFAENLKSDGTVDQQNLRKATATDVYTLKGGEEEKWEPRFTYHGFRYIQMEGFPGRAKS